MTSATELHALSELNHAHLVSVLLSEEGNGTQLLGLINGHVPMVLQRNILTNACIDYLLHPAQLLVGNLLEV